MTRALLLAGLCLVATSAAAEPTVLRLATIAPDGSSWAREMRAFSREVEARTESAVRIKWYFGGVAGTEFEMLDRIRKGQLDGGVGALICAEVAPSLRAFSAVGLFQSREESSYALRQLIPSLEPEALKSGYALLAVSGIGPVVIFSRKPVRTMAELRGTRLWEWDLDRVHVGNMAAMGLNAVKLPVEEAAHAYRDGKVDGFLAMPSAALVFQWSTQARYITDLRTGYLPGCVIIANRAFDRLPSAQQQAIRSAGAKLDRRMEEINTEQDNLLLGGLFAKQGLTTVPVSDRFRAEFFAAAREARGRVPDTLIPRETLDRMLRILADYRAEHSVK